MKTQFVTICKKRTYLNDLNNLKHYRECQPCEFALTGSLAVVRVNDDNADDEQLHAPPHNLPEQRATAQACAQQGVDRQRDGCAHDEHKPGGGGKCKVSERIAKGEVM